MGISFRRRRRVNWRIVALLIVLAAAGSVVYVQSMGIPGFIKDLPVIPKTPTPTPVPVDDGSVLMALGENLWHQGKLTDAATAYLEAASVSAAAAEQLAGLAVDFQVRDRLEEAAIKRNASAQAKARAATAHARVATILAVRGWNSTMTAQAVETAKQALSVDPANGEALAALALAYDRDGKYDLAIDSGLAAVAKDAKNAEAYAFLAEAYADNLPTDPRAKAAAKRALELNDKSALAHRNYGYVLETEGDYREAAAEYLKAIGLLPNLAPLYFDLGRVYYIKLDRYAEAVAAFRRAVEIDPRNPQAHTELGRAYSSRSEYRLAETSLLAAIEADPSYAVAYANLGWVYYFGMRRYDQAVPQLQKALEIGRFTASRAAEYYVELGWSLYFLNRCSEARPAFQKALDLLIGQPSAGIASQAQSGMASCAGR